MRRFGFISFRHAGRFLRVSMGVENVFRANHNIIPPSLASPVRMFTENYVAELINNRPGGKIFYTTDGSEPDENSRQYSKPFKLSQTTTIKAYTKWEDAQSRVVSYQIEKKDAMPSTLLKTGAGGTAHISPEQPYHLYSEVNRKNSQNLTAPET